eukprot:1805369-Pyramimonas_sp.AAC.1
MALGTAVAAIFTLPETTAQPTSPPHDPPSGGRDERSRGMATRAEHVYVRAPDGRVMAHDE